LRSIALRPLLVVLLAAQLGACTPPSFIAFPPQTRGNKVDPELLAQLVPGTSSRADVSALLGAPTTRGSFDDNTWIYITEVTKPMIGGTQDVEDQEVVKMTFDQNGTLRGITKRGAEDGKDVKVVARATPSPGSDATLLQQLLGNVGRFSASPISSQQNTTGGQGGANKF
jgi:outer membrane protein assembly factor BamE (lipoprotein component of BamABCDE complex)